MKGNFNNFYPKVIAVNAEYIQPEIETTNEKNPILNDDNVEVTHKPKRRNKHKHHHKSDGNDQTQPDNVESHDQNPNFDDALNENENNDAEIDSDRNANDGSDNNDDNPPAGDDSYDPLNPKIDDLPENDDDSPPVSSSATRNGLFSGLFKRKRRQAVVEGENTNGLDDYPPSFKLSDFIDKMMFIQW